MRYIAVVTAALVVMLVVCAYGSSSMFLFVSGAIEGGITCSPQGGGKTYCCASVKDPDNTYGYTTYCTTCDDTNPPSNCSEREIPLVVANPGKVLSDVLEGGVLEEPTTPPKLGQNVIPREGGVLEDPTTLPNFSQSVGPNVGIFQTENNLTFSQANISRDNSTNSLAQLQSEVEDNTNREGNAEEEQDESKETEDEEEENE